MQTKALSLRWTLGAAALAILLWLAGNSAMFWAIYHDALTPLSLPYLETFTARQRLDYRQFGGEWRLQEQRLVQNDATKADLFAVIPLPLAPDQGYQFGVRAQVLAGANGAGLAFNLQQKNDLRQSHLVRLGATDGRTYLVFGYFDENDQFVEQGAQPAIDLSQGAILSVRIQDNTYSVLIDDQVQQANIPLQYHGGYVGLMTWFSSVAFDDVTLTALTATRTDEPLTAKPVTQAAANPTTALPIQPVTEATAMPAMAPLTTTTPVLWAQNFAEAVDQTQWRMLSGEWQFTADALIQSKQSGFDYSIIHAARFTQFVLRVRFRHGEGTAGGGVLFNRPDQETPKQGHMVRYDQGKALIWGYFDDQGNFVAQGYQAVEPPGAQPHTLQISSDGNVYAILLDDSLLVADVPLISKEGHIGLTAAQSVVAFESVAVTALPPTQKQTEQGGSQ